MPNKQCVRASLSTDLDRALSLLDALQQGLWGQGFTIRRRRSTLRCRPARRVDVRLTARSDGPRRSLTIRLAWPVPPPVPTTDIGRPGLDAKTLRRAFRNALDEKDFRAALAFGEHIERDFPGSAMARQVAKLRPHLTRRANIDK